MTFRRGTTEILHGITFTVRAGEHWALLGPNGAGKSTILGLCGALAHPTSGTVRILGRQLGRVELQALRRSIGHVHPRHAPRPPLTVRALICDPELLLLDEPSTGLDVTAREQLLETIDLLGTAHPGIASVLVTHHLEELPATTTHALLITGGRLVAAGEVGGVLTTEHVSAAFEHPIQVGREDGRWTARAIRRASAYR